MEIGYALSSEEHGPEALVRHARMAEEAGFSFAFVSDHFHPWTDRQGQSPFVWTVLGAIAGTTERLRLGTGVTCPTIRIHPAIVAQAAATTAALSEGRFTLAVGTGENLNEHILGDRWPSHEERLEMLEEAIEVMRLLWQGDLVTHRGRHYTVDRARLYTLPHQPPPVAVAAGGTKAVALAGRAGDALVATVPDPDLVAGFDESGGTDKPRYGKLTVCWAETEEEAIRIAHEWWPNAGLAGEVGLELALPRYFHQAASMLTPDQVAKAVVCSPNPDRHREALDEFARAGFDHVYVHQVGPNQDGFIRFYEQEILSLAMAG